MSSGNTRRVVYALRLELVRSRGFQHSLRLRPRKILIATLRGRAPAPGNSRCYNPRVTEPVLLQQQLRTPVLRRSFHKPYPVAVRGAGVYVWDGDGKRYLDFS